MMRMIASLAMSYATVAIILMASPEATSTKIDRTHRLSDDLRQFRSMEHELLTQQANAKKIVIANIKKRKPNQDMLSLHDRIVGSGAVIPEVLDLPDNRMDQVLCRALSIYHEGRKNHLQMVSMAWIVENRMKSRRYPSDACSVVWQKTWMASKQKMKAQFDWIEDDMSDFPRERRSWAEAQRVALAFELGNPPPDPTLGSTGFCRVDIPCDEWWSKVGMHKVAVVEGQKFLKYRDGH